MTHITHKKNLIVSYKNLSDDLKDLFQELYPDGYKDYLQRTVKPNGESIFTVPMETKDTCYLVKFEVKIDSSMLEEDLDKDLYDDKDDEGPELAPISEAIEKEEGTDRDRVGKMRHGSYEDFESMQETSNDFGINNDVDLKEVLNSDTPEEEDFDRYVDEDYEDEDEEDEPDDDELLAIEEGLIDDNGEIKPLDEKPNGKTERNGKKTKAAATKREKRPTAKATEKKATGKEAKAADKPAARGRKKAVVTTVATAKVNSKKAAPVKSAKATAVKSVASSAKKASPAKAAAKSVTAKTAKVTAAAAKATKTAKDSKTLKAVKAVKATNTKTSKVLKTSKGIKISAKAAEQAAIAAKAVMAEKASRKKLGKK